MPYTRILYLKCIAIKAMYVLRNIKFRSSNHVARKAIHVTYSERVFVAFINQHALRISHIAVCDLSGYRFVFHIIS